MSPASPTSVPTLFSKSGGPAFPTPSPGPRQTDIQRVFGASQREKLWPVLWPPDAKSRLTGKDPDAGKHRGERWQRMRWFDGITDSRDMSLSMFWETVKEGKPGTLQSVGSQRVRQD